MVIGVRLAWMFMVPAVAHLRIVTREPRRRRERLVLGWSGMRGAVSLAAALAIPTDAGRERDLVIFLAYGVVVVTLVVPGLTLAPLIRRLGLARARSAGARRSRRGCGSRARRSSGSTSSASTCEPARGPRAPARPLPGAARPPRDRLEEAERPPDHGAETAPAQIEALEAERELLSELRRERAFPADLLVELEAELDVDEARVRSRAS